MRVYYRGNDKENFVYNATQKLGMIQGNELTLLREALRVSEQQHPAEIFWSQVNKEDTKFAKTLKT
jgi:hypothetical protein